MIEVEMNKDIRQIEPKVLFGLSGRQITFACAGIGTGLIIALLIPGETTVKVIAGAVCGIPILLCGFVKVFGLTLDRFIKQMSKSMFDSPVRRYESETAFAYMDSKIREIKKVKRAYKGYK